MPTTNTASLFDAFIDRLAEALSARLGSAPAAARAPAAAVAATKPARRRKGAKRDPALIAAMTAQLLAQIKGSSGQRIEQLAKILRISTADLKLPAQKLLAAKKVKTKGTRRGTRYFAA